jgi:flagellar biosynthetic protein FliQ
MSDALLLDVMSNAVKTLMLVLAPIMLGTLAIGLVISVFQAVTQINEQTLTFVPKLVAAFAILLFAGPWMASQMMQFTTQLFTMLPQMAR